MRHVTPVSNYGFVKRDFSPGSSAISIHQHYAMSFIYIHIL